MVLLTSPFLGWSQDKESLVTQADTLLQREDYAGALALYNKILEKSKLSTSDDYALLYKRAYCYYGLGKFENALSDVNQYLQKVPDPQARLLRAYINQELQNNEAQLEDLNTFLAANPTNDDLLRWRASVLMDMERYADARKDIQQLIKSNPGPELKSYLGLTYYYEDAPDSALAIFDEVIAENPNDVRTYLYATSLALEQEAYGLALQYSEKGLRVEPANTTLLFYKGIALIQNEQTDDGCRCLTKAFAGGMDDAGDYLKSYCYGVD